MTFRPAPGCAFVRVSVVAALIVPASAWAQQTMPAGPPVGAEVPVPLVRSVQVTGVRVLKPGQVTDAAKTAVGQQGTRDVIRRATESITALYRQKGFPVAQITSAVVTPEGVLQITVAEGTIRNIVVRGNRRTRTSTILAALNTLPGDVYKEERVRADRQRLARLGIFGDVTISALPIGTPELPEDISIEPDGKGKAPRSLEVTTPPISPAPLAPDEDAVGKVDLVVRVKERQTVNIAATLGYADRVGALGFVDVSEDNLAGTAQRVSIQWQRTTNSYLNSDGTFSQSNARQAANFSYEKPVLGNRHWAYGLDVYDKNTVFLPFFSGNNDTIRTYERRKGARGRVGHAIGGNVTGFLTARRDEVGYSDAIPFRLNPPYGAIANAQGTVGAVGGELVADGRDAADSPRRGYLNAISFERASSLFGGNRVFSQTTLDLRGYTPLSTGKSGPVFALRLLGGTSQGDVPLSEQYFLGGYELLRGYDLYSVYGDRMVLGTAELRVPLSEALQGVVFTDYGNAWQPGQRVSITSLKAGVGAGLRFLSPIGAIRFDAAYGSRLQTYVSLGQSF